MWDKIAENRYWKRIHRKNLDNRCPNSPWGTRVREIRDEADQRANLAEGDNLALSLWAYSLDRAVLEGLGTSAKWKNLEPAIELLEKKLRSIKTGKSGIARKVLGKGRVADTVCYAIDDILGYINEDGSYPDDPPIDWANLSTRHVSDEIPRW